MGSNKPILMLLISEIYFQLLKFYQHQYEEYYILSSEIDTNLNEDTKSACNIFLLITNA